MPQAVLGLAEVRIPDHRGPTALAYGVVPVDTQAPEWSEPLVELAEYGIAGEGYYARSDGHNAPYRRAFHEACSSPVCRRTVAEKLAVANQTLHRAKLELFVLDGHRTIACQQELWDHFVDEAKRVLDRPSPDEIRSFAGQYCSDPTLFNEDDPTTWPTHSTGGAVDVTLRLVGTGEPIFMGGIYDDPSEVSHTAFYEDPPEPIRKWASASEARRNRRILYHLLAKLGFVNYSYEWWHFDYGTQMSIANAGGHPHAHVHRPAAIYGTIPRARQSRPPTQPNYPPF